MAGAHPFLTKLRRVVKTLDDDALVALANRGLLRRAKKDLTADRPVIVDVEDDRIRLQLGGAVVEVPEFPPGSTCDCPAGGVCRHILAALLYLRDSEELDGADSGDASQDSNTPNETTSGPAASPAEVFANLDDEAIRKWAGKALLRKANRALAAGPKVEIEVSEKLVVSFPDQNVTCRWIPSGQLTGMMCSCQAEKVCEHVVAAVLAYQASLGLREVEIKEDVLKASSGTPRTRAEVLQSIGLMLREIVSLGLSRLSEATAQRLTTLAISAHGVDLPRLERMLKSLANGVQLSLRRDAQFSAADILSQAARIEAVRLALGKKTNVSLVGQHRTRYDAVGQISVFGVGAQHWRSKGGYHGVTLFFWDDSRKAWATWSDTRPVTQPDFNPQTRFDAEGPWVGCSSPRDASRSVLRLSGAWRNMQGRISGRPGTRALITGSTSLDDIPDKTSDWSVLAERAKRLFGGGLAGRTENMDLVLLLPEQWGPSFYDTLRQELRRPVADTSGRIIDLWLPFTPEQQEAVELLEKHDPADGEGVFGSLRLVDGSLCVQPISLLSDSKIVHLNLPEPMKPSAGKRSRKRKPKRQLDGEEEPATEPDEDTLPETITATSLGRILTTARAELEAIAESGVAVRRDLELLEDAGRRLDAIGLRVCARKTSQFVESLVAGATMVDPTRHNETAERLLHAYYVLRLAADQDTISTACKGLTAEAPNAD